MKIFLTLLFLLFAGCQTTTNTNKPANFSATDIESVVNARLVLYKSDATESDFQKAEESLKAIPNSSTEYSEAQSLLKSFERKKKGESTFESTTKTTVTEPKIGMSQSDFNKLCGSPGDKQTREMSGRTVTVYINQYKNFANGCGGVFTFVDYKLDTIGGY